MSFPDKVNTFSLYTRAIFDNAHNHYPEFLVNKDFKQVHPENFQHHTSQFEKTHELWKDGDYIGCGCTSNDNHIYLTLTCTLPLFNQISEANKELLLHFGWERKFEHYKLKNELSTPQKTLHFFSRCLHQQRSMPQSFAFKPEQLKKIVALVQDVMPQKSDAEIIYEILNNPESAGHKKLFHLTLQNLDREKNSIIQENWNRAKLHLKHFRIFSFIKEIWNNLQVRLDTKHLVKDLKNLQQQSLSKLSHSDPRTRIHLGEYWVGDDMTAVVDQVNLEDLNLKTLA